MKFSQRKGFRAADEIKNLKQARSVKIQGGRNST